MPAVSPSKADVGREEEWPAGTEQPQQHPIADSVRLALPTEAEAIAAIQRRSWADRLPAGLSDRMLAEATLDAVTEAWRQSITRPPEARFRVLVAIGHDQ